MAEADANYEFDLVHRGDVLYVSPQCRVSSASHDSFADDWMEDTLPRFIATARIKWRGESERFSRRVNDWIRESRGRFKIKIERHKGLPMRRLTVESPLLEEGRRIAPSQGCRDSTHGSGEQDPRVPTRLWI